MEPGSGYAADERSRGERTRRLVLDLQQRGEARTRRLRQAAERSLRTRRELVRLVRKEIRHRIRAGRGGSSLSDAPPEVPRAPSSSKS